MKINEKLSEIGFSEDTINSLTESQIDQLLSLLLGEATTKTQTVKTTDYSSSEIAAMKQKGEGLNVTNGEVSPLPDGGMRVLQKAGKSEAPKNKVIKDGEMSEGKKKSKKKYNPWAICTASVGRKDMDKYERCVMDVKESIKEGKNPYEVVLESKFDKILSNNVNARISKKDFLSLLETKSKESMMTSAPLVSKTKMKKPIGKLMFGKGEMSEVETAPAKPKVKPGTETRPRPSHPGRNPKPGEGPAPAKASDMKKKKDEFMAAINKILKK